jgi:chorismate mutase/prephenate dehydratase
MSVPRKTPARRLEVLREEVEATDDRILALIRKRMDLARAIGSAKEAAGLPVLDPVREARVVRRVATQARALAMPAEEVRSLFWGIIALCRSEQVASRRQAAARGPRR